eukprot:gene22816-31113_t
MTLEQNSSILDQATDSGIMEGLQELIDLEIELKPTTMMDLGAEFSKESQLHFQKQYVEYSLKVKVLLQKLLRKLENNYEYQRYLEDEIKLLETGGPSSIVVESGCTPPSMINRPSQEFSSIINGAVDFISTKALDVCPVSLNEELTSESELNEARLYRSSPSQTEKTDDDNVSIKDSYAEHTAPVNPKDVEVVRELDQLRKENAALKTENARMKLVRKAELDLIIQATTALSIRIELLNTHFRV